MFDIFDENPTSGHGLTPLRRISVGAQHAVPLRDYVEIAVIETIFEGTAVNRGLASNAHSEGGHLREMARALRVLRTNFAPVTAF
jgi:hypothetical protein